MKSFVVVLLIASAGMVFYNFTTPASTANSSRADQAFVIPDSVKAVIDNSCFMCHNSGAKNDKSKAKLSFDELDKLTTFQLVGKLGDIQEELNKGEMPPEKFISKFPEHALSDKNKQLLLNWAKETADNLSKN